MSSEQIAIRVTDLGKCYQVYRHPQDRLKQYITPRLRGLLGRAPKRYYQEFWALRNASFEIERGETVGIVGRNGSGKSTLLQLICGTLTPTIGHVDTRGRISALLELGSGFNPEFTGRENVLLNGALHGLSRQVMEERFERIAAFADIGHYIDQPVKTYSSGMYARLAFSASIFVDPDILIVDEILAVGDAPFQAKCMKTFHALRDNGCTILLVAHDAYMIKNFCQRAVYLREGEMVAVGTSTEVVDQYMIEVEKAMSSNLEVPPDAPRSEDAFEAGGVGMFRVVEVQMLGADGEPADVVSTGEAVQVRFSWRSLAPRPADVTFVINLYRHDGLYIFGTTSLMDGHAPWQPATEGVVTVNFPALPLLSGEYVWRVAINDDRAFGVYAEANRVCPFAVRDQLEAVGLVNVERGWTVDMKVAP